MNKKTPSPPPTDTRSPDVEERDHIQRRQRRSRPYPAATGAFPDRPCYDHASDEADQSPGSIFSSSGGDLQNTLMTTQAEDLI